MNEGVTLTGVVIALAICVVIVTVQVLARVFDLVWESWAF